MKMAIAHMGWNRMRRSGDSGPVRLAGEFPVVPVGLRRGGAEIGCCSGLRRERAALGALARLSSGSDSAFDSGCMTKWKLDSMRMMQSALSQNAFGECSDALCTMSLTTCVIAGRDVKIYLKRSFRAGLMQGGGMKAQIARQVLYAVFLACMLCPVPVMAENSYVGTAACKDCHEEEYGNFTKFAKKAHSDKSIKIMASDLTEAELAECYACHTTGYGKPGGFVSYEKTPHVADAGCEVCHGPGHDHVESGGDAGLIKGKLSMEDCEGCHNESRVKAFNFKPLLYGGAH